MHDNPSILWFRLDLRLEDNEALVAAVDRDRPVIPVFIWHPDDEGAWPAGAASKWWLHQSLKQLAASLEDKGSRLILCEGEAHDVLKDLVASTGADAIFWNRRYEPRLIERDSEIKEALQDMDITVKSFNSALLYEPWEVETNQGGPYKVFTPFWKKCMTLDEPAEPLPIPNTWRHPKAWPDSVSLEDLDLEPRINWVEGMAAAWQPGEEAARAELDRFLDEALHGYSKDRDRPSLTGTSRMSPHLHFGEISPRTIWHRVREASEAHQTKGLFKGAETYLSEIGWREFAHHLLFHFPDTTDQPLRPEFEDFPWADDNAEQLKAWQRGQTGYPIVDAGMRELWHTGWMHNRVRMITASFLVKDLLIPWQEGARWFWDTLVDADLASNTLGWQWTAGCGADAAPYFRILNPILQGEKFDPDGTYVKKWIPALADLPAKWIHKPWKAPEDVLKKAEVTLGDSYPHPIVDHGEARDRALEAYSAIKKN